MSREHDRSIHELKQLWANIAKGLQYHQNQFSKLSQRLRELKGVMELQGLKAPPLPNSIGWVLEKD